MKRKRKGFTLLELVIVIAVFAVLMAILIPTFVGIIRRAKLSVDQTTVKNLNTMAFEHEKTSGKSTTIRQAIAVANENNINIEALTPTADNAYILWDSVNDRWILFDAKEHNVVMSDKNFEIPADVYLWNINTVYSTTEGYSVYLKNGYNGTQTLDVTTGIDVGHNTNVKSISYVRDKNLPTQDVIIYTNGGTLRIDAGNDIVRHYGIAEDVNIVSIKSSSYHEFGTVPFVEIAKGRIVLEDNATISHIHIDKKTESSFDEVIITKEEDTPMPTLSRDSLASDLGTGVLVAEIQTGDSSQFVWLAGNGTIEDSQVLVSTSINGEKTAVTSENAQDYIKQIANTKENGNVVEGGVNKEAAKSTSIDNYYSGDNTPTNIPASTVLYYSYQGELVMLNSVTAENFENIPDGVVVNFCKDVDMGSTYVDLSDKNITIRGVGSTKPMFKGHIKIYHTSGNHTLELKNILFKFSATNKSIIVDKSVCTNQNDINILKVTDCDFFCDINANDLAFIAFIPTSGITGTQLIADGNIFRTDSYDQENKVGYITTALGLCANGASGMYGNAYSYRRHIITNNQFFGKMYYSLVATYLEFSNNLVDLKCYDGTTLKENGYRAFQLRGATGNGGQLDTIIKNNTFKNLNEIIKFYNTDNIADMSVIHTDCRSSTDIDANTFENVVAFASGTSSGNYTESIREEVAIKTWTGITNTGIDFVLAKVKLTLEGTLHTDSMTINYNGTMYTVTTYTQAIAPATGRTGYYVMVDGHKLWYFATRAYNERYFIDDETNQFYIVRLTDGGAVTYDDLHFVEGDGDTVNFDDANKGNIYASKFRITNFETNTIYNATAVSANGSNNKVIVTAIEGKTNKDINIFISNTRNKTKLFITSDEDANAPADTLIYVVPNGTGLVYTSGNLDVTIDTAIGHYSTIGKQTITVNAVENSDTILGSLTITGSKAKDSIVTNYGTIKVLKLHAKTTVTNTANATIKSLHVSYLEAGATTIRYEATINACGSTITNYGTIGYVGTMARMTLTNEEGASIRQLDIMSVGDDVLDYIYDSVIVNNGFMCVDNGGVINLEVRCHFTNNGIIGAEGRDGSCNTTEANCEHIGGTIMIGRYSLDANHDGLVFINNGLIRAGARHNDGATISHQQFTFWVIGVQGRTGDPISVTVLNNTAEYPEAQVLGTNWYLNYGNVQDINLESNLDYYHLN